MTKEAMTLALEALQFMDSHYISLPQQGMQAIKALEEALAKQEQGEPVAWMRSEGVGSPIVTEELCQKYPEYRLFFTVPLYTTPQPAQKPLTDEQIEGIAQMTCIGISPHEDTLNFARVIEAAHGIKENT